jgi:hypothetical protein
MPIHNILATRIVTLSCIALLIHRNRIGYKDRVSRIDRSDRLSPTRGQNHANDKNRTDRTKDANRMDHLDGRDGAGQISLGDGRDLISRNDRGDGVALGGVSNRGRGQGPGSEDRCLPASAFGRGTDQRDVEGKRAAGKPGSADILGLRRLWGTGIRETERDEVIGSGRPLRYGAIPLSDSSIGHRAHELSVVRQETGP